MLNVALNYSKDYCNRIIFKCTISIYKVQNPRLRIICARDEEKKRKVELAYARERVQYYSKFIALSVTHLCFRAIIPFSDIHVLYDFQLYLL